MFLGDVAAWYVNDLAGINFTPDHPGFEDVLIAPHFVKGPDSVCASYRSVRGLVSSEWHRRGNKVLLTVVIPSGVTGRIMVDGRVAAIVGVGEHLLTF